MKISEQARKAAHSCRMRPEINHPTVIQEAINDHERDLVESAQGLVNQAAKFGAVPIDAFPLVNEIKAALDRRRE